MPAAPASTGTRIAFRVLGPLTVVRDGAEIAIAGARQRALLTYLLLHANRVVPTERLVDELFGDEPPESALNSVHTGISRLRRQLPGPGADGTTIVTRPPGYIVELDRGQLDLHVFEDLLQTGRRQLDSGKPEEARKTLGEALELWRGEPFSGLSAYAFARDEGARLEDMRLAAVLERIDADLALGRHAEVIGELERLQAGHPFQERLRAQLMLALYRSGRQADALQAYQDTRRALASELGLEPGKPLQRLEQQILNQDPELDLAPRESSIPAVTPVPETRTSAGRILLIGTSAAVAVLVALVVLTHGDDAPTLRAIAPNSVGVIDAKSNRLVAELPLGQSPKGIVAGGGAIWVVNTGDATLSRIDPARRVVLRTITLPGAPSDAAFAGSVWVLHNRGTSFVDPFAGSATLSEVNPHFDNVSRSIKVPAGFGNDYEDPIAAGGGAVWVAGPTGISKVDLSSGRVHERLSLHEVTDLVAREGSVWALQRAGTIVHIDPSGDFVAQTVSLSATLHATAAAAGYGSLWVIGKRSSAPRAAQGQSAGSLFRVDPRNGEVSAKLQLDGSPVAVAAGQGAVWIADSERREVVRIDPSTNRVLARISLGARPTSIAVDENAVWVTVT